MRSFAVFALSLLVSPACGCSGRLYDVAATPRPAPAAPRKIAVDGNDFAILAGDERSHGVFVLDARGVVVRSFSVSQYDVDLVVDPATGAIYTAYTRGKVGALEKWSPAGKQLATISLPLPALALSNLLDGVGYVLAGNDDVRVAIAYDAARARLGRTVALPRGVASIAQASRDELAYISPTSGDLEFKSTRTGALRITKVPGDSVTCSFPDKRCFVLNGPRGARAVEIVDTTTNLLFAQLPAIRGTSGLAVDETGDLAIVGGDARVGSFETFSSDAIGHAGLKGSGP